MKDDVAQRGGKDLPARDAAMIDFFSPSRERKGGTKRSGERARAHSSRGKDHSQIIQATI